MGLKTFFQETPFLQPIIYHKLGSIKKLDKVLIWMVPDKSIISISFNLFFAGCFNPKSWGQEGAKLALEGFRRGESERCWMLITSFHNFGNNGYYD